jgi:hypothetical protein
MTTKIFLSLIAILTTPLLSPGLSFADGEADLFTRFPVTEQVALSNGIRMGLPLHVTESRGAVLAGLADHEALAEILAPQQLRPLKVLPGKGLVMFFFMDYESTALGPYQELVVLIAASRKSGEPRPVLDAIEGFIHLLAVYVPLISGKLSSSTGDYGFYTWKLWVTSEVSRLAGLEVWGFPKSLAQIENQIEPRNTNLVVADSEGVPIVSARQRGRSHPAVPMTLDLQMFTPLEILPTRTRGIAETRSVLVPFTQDDQLAFGTDSEWGLRLKSIGFTPLLWQIMPEVQAVFLKPHGNRP